MENYRYTDTDTVGIQDYNFNRELKFETIVS